MTPLEQFLLRAEALLLRVEGVLPPAIPREPDWKRSFAFRWKKRGGSGFLQPAGIIGSIIGAIIVLLIWSRVSGRRTARV